MLFAALCVNAEGEAGWGGNLPAWEPVNPDASWLKILSWTILLGREVNGFVLFAITFFIGAFLLIPIWGWTHEKTLNLQELYELICFFAIFSVIEDFIWFLINPTYGLIKFSPNFIPWHPYWLWIMPIDYYLGIIVASIFGILANGWKWYLIVIGIISLFLIITTAICAL